LPVLNPSPDLHPSSRTRRWRLVVAALLVLGGGVVQAQMYSCTTASGQRINADRPPPECADRTIRVMRLDGTPMPSIEPPPTPEERRKRELEEKRRIEEAELKLQQKRSDRSLLETYSTVEEIEAHRSRFLGDLQANIDRGTRQKLELQRERKKLDEESEFYTKRELPEKLKRQLAANNEMMKSQDKLIADMNAEKARVNSRFDALAKRFRELVDAGATPIQRHADRR
jgi:hypothetical protein